MHFLTRIAAALTSGVRTLSPDCREASRLQSEAMDRPRSPAQRFGLGVHLLLCSWCRRYGKQVRFLRHAAHEHHPDADRVATRTLTAETRDRLKQSLRREAR